MKKIIMGGALLSLLIAAGCTNTSVEKQVSEVVNDLQQSEKNYETAQAQIAEIEKSEQQLFDETLGLTQDQKDEVKANAAKLTEQLDERLATLQKEKEAMEEANGKMDQFDAAAKDADEEEAAEVEKLKNAVSERYSLHAQFMTDYEELAGVQKELYKMLTEESTDFKSVNEQVFHANEQNEKVQASLEAFNKATERVNELKEEVITRLAEKE